MKHYRKPDGQFVAVTANPQDDWVEVSIEDVKAEVEAFKKAERAARPYDQKRKDEYPSIGDQLDALFHAGVFPADMEAQIQAVKDKYPKV